MSSPEPEHLVLYDGVCGLCDRSVRWLLRHDARGLLRFAPLLGPTADAARARDARVPQDATRLASVVYLAGARVHLRSKAFFHLAWHLRWPWRFAYYWRWLPAFLTDLPYRLVAAVRYKVWGKKDACTLPAPDKRERFLP